jgi:putative heme-binding domain-containing protein
MCHKAEGFGHEIGPNLAAMKSRGAESILVNVLDPNREVNPQYLGYLVLTHDGRTLTGMISGEGATSITLRRAESATDEVLRSDIERIQSTGLSIMPEGFEEVIYHEEMSDLISYILTLP